MAAEEVSSAAERQVAIDRRLDDIDRALLGLLPRADRLAVMANVEARLQAASNSEMLELDTPVNAPAVSSAVSPVTTRPRNRGRRSRMALTSGVLGIVAASCLVVSPLLLIILSAFGELLGETFSILLFGVLAALVTLGGGFAVCLGVIGLLRLARRGQTATGTGWAITGLCTGALPMLLGIVGVLSLAATIMPTNSVEVSWNAGPSGPVPYQVASHPTMYPSTPADSPYGYAPVPYAPSSFPAAQPAKVPSLGPMTLPPALPVDPKSKPTEKAEPMPEVKPETKPEMKSDAKPE